MPLHTTTVLAPRHPRLARAAAIATACVAAGAATVVIADDQPAPQVRTIAGQPDGHPLLRHRSQQGASMRALGRHIAEQRANRTSRYQDGCLHCPLPCNSGAPDGHLTPLRTPPFVHSSEHRRAAELRRIVAFWLGSTARLAASPRVRRLGASVEHERRALQLKQRHKISDPSIPTRRPRRWSPAACSPEASTARGRRRASRAG